METLTKTQKKYNKLFKKQGYIFDKNELHSLKLKNYDDYFKKQGYIFDKNELYHPQDKSSKFIELVKSFKDIFFSSGEIPILFFTILIIPIFLLSDLSDFNKFQFQSITIENANENNISLQLNNKDYYFKHPNNDNFEILENDSKKCIFQGTQMTDTMFYEYVKKLTNDSNVQFLQKGTNQNNQGYYFYKIKENNTEIYNYIVWLGNENSAIFLKGNNDKQKVQDTFSHLEFN